MNFAGKTYRTVKQHFFGMLLTSAILLILTVLLQFLPMVRPDETAFLKVRDIIKHNIFHYDPKPFVNRTVFINVSRDLMLVADTNRLYRNGKIVITDRQKLGAFFAILNRHQNAYRFLLCDIIIDHALKGDSLLKEEMGHLTKVAFSADDHNSVVGTSMYNPNYGIVNYRVQGGSFNKMPILINKQSRSLPAKVFEMIDHTTFTGSFVPFLNGRPLFNEVIPDLYFRKADLIDGKNYVELDDVLFEDETTFNEYLKDKYIIIGNFETDLHDTYLGEVPGPMILWDIYLTLKISPPYISWSWLLFTWLYYFVLSYYFFIKPKKQIWYQKMAQLPLVNKVIKKYVSCLGALILLSLISLLIFNIFISLFYIASVITIWNFFADRSLSLKEKAFNLVEGKA